MSAFIVNKKHIDALVTWAGAQHYQIHYYPNGGDWLPIAGREDEVGQVLVNENYRSVNYRYDESDKPDRYLWSQYSQPLSAVQVIKACNCFDYQACETDDYPDSEATAIIKAIREQAIRQLPGYEEAQWELD